MKKLFFILLFPIGFPVWAIIKSIHWIFCKLTHNTITYVDTRLDGFEFEQFVARQLRRNGYYNVKVTQASGDYGVDIVACYKNRRYGIQCKLYSNPVGNKAVQEIAAGLPYYDCDYGVVVTNNAFTNAAVRLAQANDILLWDREALIGLMHKRLPKTRP